MKIAVCMKQVPAYQEGDMDEKTGRLIRSGLESVVNVYDLAALETALVIKERTNAEITVFTMGPKKAEQVIREAYALGAEKGYLICDEAFGGADVLATSYTLMQALQQKGPYDLIICGKQTTDGDTAQVGGALARWLGIFHMNGVTELAHISEEEITFRCQTDYETLTIKKSFPCLLAVERSIYIPRMPSLKLKMEGRKKSVPVIRLSDLADGEKGHYGLAGSATKVKKIFPPYRTRKQEIKEMDGEDAALYIENILKDRSKVPEEDYGE